MAGKGQPGPATERARFARICVEVDLRKTLVSKFVFEDEEFKIEYEGLNLICFECGKFGHKKEACPQVLGGGDGQTVPVQKEGSPANMEAPEAAFGPWMIAKRPTRNTSKRPVPAAGNARSDGGKHNGTRFSALSNMEVDEIGEIPKSGAVSPETQAPIRNLRPNSPNRNIPAHNSPIITPTPGPTVSNPNVGNQSTMIGAPIIGTDPVVNTPTHGSTAPISNLVPDPTSATSQVVGGSHTSKPAAASGNPKLPTQQTRTGQNSVKDAKKKARNQHYDGLHAPSGKIPSKGAISNKFSGSTSSQPRERERSLSPRGLKSI